MSFKQAPSWLAEPVVSLSQLSSLNSFAKRFARGCTDVQLPHSRGCGKWVTEWNEKSLQADSCLRKQSATGAQLTVLHCRLWSCQEALSQRRNCPVPGAVQSPDEKWPLAKQAKYRISQWGNWGREHLEVILISSSQRKCSPQMKLRTRWF